MGFTVHLFLVIELLRKCTIIAMHTVSFGAIMRKIILMILENLFVLPIRVFVMACMMQQDKC